MKRTHDVQVSNLLNKSLLTLFISTFFIIVQIDVSQAQCPNNNVAGPPGNTFTDMHTAQPCLSGAVSISGHEYHRFSVKRGLRYRFHTCSGPQQIGDTEITGYVDQSGGSSLFHNNNSCGSRSDVSWTSTFTGNIRVLMGENNCSTVWTGNSASLNYQSLGPVNDHCSSAISVSAGTNYPFELFCADGTDISSCGFNDVNDIWYRFDPPCSGHNAVFSLCASTGSLDPVMAVYTGSCAAVGSGTGTQLECNDDFCGTRSQVTMDVDENTTYYIRISGFNGAVGPGVLQITNPGPPASAGTISGTSNPCPGANHSYSISAVSGASSYTWAVPSGASINSGQGTTSISVTFGSNGGSITVTPINDCGSGSSSSKTITLKTQSATPTTMSASPTSHCGSGSSTLTVNGGSLGTGAQWYWYSGSCGGTLVTSGPATSITVTPSSTTTYYVRAQGDCNTTSCRSAVVTIHTPPTAEAGTGANICAGACVQIGQTPIPTESYQWSSPSGTGALSSATVANPVACPPAGTHFYTLTVTDANGCTASDQVTVNVNPAPSASFTGLSTSYCTNESATLLTGSPTGGQFSGPGIINNFTFDPSVAGPGTHVINYIVFNTFGCGDTATQSTVVYSTPVANAGSDKTICNGSAVTLNGGSTSGTQPITYSWLPTTGLSNPNISNPSASPSSNQLYTLTATDANGCQTSDQVQVNVNPSPSADAGPNATICLGESVVIGGVPTGSGGTGTLTFLWNPTAGLNNPNIANPSASPTLTTSYSVTVTDANLCSAVGSMQVVVNDLPTLTLNASNVPCNGGGNGSIDLVVAGGQFPFTYNWNNGASSEDLSNLSPGNYSVTVQDANGCTATGSASISQPNPMQTSGSTSNYNGVEISCNGATDGSINVTVFGGTPPYSFLWSSGQTTQNLSGISAGTYMVTISDDNGCNDVLTFVMDEPDAIVISGIVSNFNGVNISCFGENDGSVNVSLTGGTTPYFYSWSSGQVSQDLSNLGPGSYTLTVTDLNSCSATITFNIVEPPVLAVVVDQVSNYNGVNISCFDAQDGSIDITASGGNGLYQYLWSDGSTISDRSNLDPGTFTVTVTDANGCTISTSATIVEPPLLTVVFDTISNFNGVNISCFGADDAFIMTTAAGGNGAYAYAWSNGSTTDDISNLPPGVYSLTVTDDNGCTAQIGTTISEPAQLASTNAISNYNGVNVSCFGSADGSIDLNVTGGIPPWSYNWSNGAATQDLNNITAGVYNVTVTDANGCEIFETIILNEPTDITSSMTKVDVDCNGNMNGSIDLTVSGGIPPYGYNWSNGANTQDISNLNGGVYMVTITDANGCVQLDTMVVGEPNPLQSVLTPSVYNGGFNISCFGGSDGFINQVISGGTPPYTVLWSTSSTDEDISGLAAGTYSVTVTDANSCTLVEQITLIEPTELTATISVSHVSCFGGNDGSATVTPSGGTQPYSYNWGGPTLGGLTAGLYVAIVTDANGCVFSINAIITQPTDLLLNLLSSSDVNCFGGNDGAATVLASGGTFPYTYAWSNGATTNSYSGFGAGTYTVIVTDVEGCTETLSVQITQPSTLFMTSSSQHVACNGGNNGGVTLSVFGGTSPFTFLWSSGATDQNLSGAAAGIYTVTTTDAGGCIATLTAQISEPSALSSGISGTDVSCNGGTNGVVIFTISGGTPPYTYDWNNGATNQNLGGLPAGTYTVTATDANGCSITESQAVTQPSALGGTNLVSDVSCYNGADGSIQLFMSGGTPGYSYTWSNGATTASQTGLAAGGYSVVVYDQNGCSFTNSFTITEPTELTLSASSVDAGCDTSQGSGGSIDLTVSGGTGPYSYAWSNGRTMEDLTGLGVGVYIVTVTDANGCTVLESKNITTISISETITHISCNGANDGIINISVTSGTPPFTYAWSNGANSFGISGLSAGSYTVTVTDSSGCDALAVYTINEPSAIQTSTFDTDIDCNGAANGSIDLSVSGGTPPYSYSWSNGANTQDISGLAPGGYVVTVTDASGCTATNNDNISEPTALGANAFGFSTSCNGGSDGTASVSAFGGTSPYSYQWSSGGTSTNVSGLTAGGYDVTITDANGCTYVASTTVFEPSAISIVSTPTDASCFGLSDGAISILPLGGTPGYSFNWSTGSTNQNIANLATGDYIVTVTDTNGCTQVDTINVGVPDEILLSATISDISCFGQSDGAINLSVSGLGTSYSYAWSTGANSQDISGLAPGTYSVTVTFVNGCTADDSYTVTEPPALVSSVTGSDVSCNGGSDGSADLTVSSGTPPYSYSWSDGSVTQDLIGVAAGSYSVTVSDANGCSNTHSVSISEPSVLTVFAPNIIPVSCNGGADGFADVAAIGGTSPFSYNWSNGDITQDLINVAAGIYNVTITDGNGCI